MPTAETSNLPEGTVTFLLTDVEGSTRRWDDDPKKMKQAVADLDELVAGVVSAHGGHLLKSRGEGDSHFCVFARASDAVAAAANIARDAFLPSRIAVHTGEAELRDGDYFGAAPNRAARLRAIAHGHQVLLSRSTADLVAANMPPHATLADRGQHRLRDLTQPEHVHELRWPGAPEHPPLNSLDFLPTNLPEQRTTFVGREREIAAVRELLRENRLVTLTGSAGCGKTRLALHVAADSVDEHASGSWFVDLAPLGDPGMIPVAIAGALGIMSRTPGGPAGEGPAAEMAARVIDHLKPQALLLVLDNCEHLVDPVAHVADDILKTCHAVRILATSREPLGVGGEASFRVPNLGVPAEDEPPERADAGHLFCDRARLGDRQFGLTPAAAHAVTRICRQLDGIPLAIELAAARVRAFGVAALADRLDDMFRILKGGGRTALARQQTLEAAIDWSHALLSPSEQVILRRLSVFAGGFTLEAAESVCSLGDLAAEEVTDAVAALLDKSLLDREDHEERVRYRMLESIRQYARPRAMGAGEGEALRNSHASWFTHFARRAGMATWTQAPDPWFEAVEDDLDNLRAAIDWTIDQGDDASAATIVGDLCLFWFFNGWMVPASGWAAELLGKPLPREAEGALLGFLVTTWTVVAGDEFARRVERLTVLAAEAPDQWWAHTTFVGDAGLAYVARDGSAYDRAMDAAIASALSLGLKTSEVGNLACKAAPGGPLPGQTGDPMAHFGAALAAARALGSPRLEVFVQARRSIEAQRAGNPELGVAAALEALPVARSLAGNEIALVQTLNTLAYALLSTDPDRALEFIDEAIANARRTSARVMLGHVVHSKGEILALAGRLDEGWRWLDDAEAIAESIGNTALVRDCRSTRALALRLTGRLADADACERDVLRWQQSIGELARYARGFRRLAQLASASGQHHRSAFLLGAFDRASGGSPATLPWFESETYASDREATLTTLGDEEFGELRSRGAAMSPEEAVAFALEETQPHAG